MCYASQTAEIMANYASNDEHHMVISVCAYMTDSVSTVGATNSERASSTPRVWYDDIFARCCSETTVIGENAACVGVELLGSSVLRHFFRRKATLVNHMS